MVLGEGNDTPLQYSCLENPMDGGAWWAVVHGVAKSRTRLSNFTFTFHFHALEKEMASHSSVLAWRIPGTGEPGGLPSMGSHRVRHDWSDLAAAYSTANPRRLGSIPCLLFISTLLEWEQWIFSFVNEQSCLFCLCWIPVLLPVLEGFQWKLCGKVHVLVSVNWYVKIPPNHPRVMH